MILMFVYLFICIQQSIEQQSDVLFKDSNHTQNKQVQAVITVKTAAWNSICCLQDLEKKIDLFLKKRFCEFAYRSDRSTKYTVSYLITQQQCTSYSDLTYFKKLSSSFKCFKVLLMKLKFRLRTKRGNENRFWKCASSGNFFPLPPLQPDLMIRSLTLHLFQIVSSKSRV